MRLPEIKFSEYFLDHNHEHNIDEESVTDALFGRRVLMSKEYTEDGKRRRRIYAKNDDTYMRIILEPTDSGFSWVLSAYPATPKEKRTMRAAKVGEDES